MRISANTLLTVWSLSLCILTNAVPATDRECLLYETIEWTYKNIEYSGNPFDIIAVARFTHLQSDKVIETELFYHGDSTWTLRFTGEYLGDWTFTTTSRNNDLDGLEGGVCVGENFGAPGFIASQGNKWSRMGWEKRAYVPNLVMYYSPDYYYLKPDLIRNDIRTFFIEHGFNGFHTRVACRWFDIHQASYENIEKADPDLRTFEALEMLVSEVYKAGGIVHIWKWGDDQRKQTPVKWGVNGQEDRRLQRYIAARLGPLPGWTMSYGFDLEEWATDNDLKEWHFFMHKHLGWFHFLGARSAYGDQPYEFMDYYAYTHFRPFGLHRLMETKPDKPMISEDRHRIRDLPLYQFKDYSMLETRRGLWQATMAGGAGAIWGNLKNSPGGYASGPYPNHEQIQTYGRFWNERFLKSMKQIPVKQDEKIQCLKTPDGAQYVFYRENTKGFSVVLSDMKCSRKAIAVDTKAFYEELDLGVYAPKAEMTFEFPYFSDWAVAVGNFHVEGATEKSSFIDGYIITPKSVLDDNGYSADMVIHPIDRSLHVVWVNSGDILYTIKDSSDRWNAITTIPDGGADVHGQEEGGIARKCLAITADEKGTLHMVFADRNGDVFYMSKYESDWSTPVRIVKKNPYTIYLDIVAANDRLVVVYEDANVDYIYSVIYDENIWSEPFNMGTSEYPSLAVGSEGCVYFLCRENRLMNYNAKVATYSFEKKQWTFNRNVTDALHRLGQGPHMAISGGRIYLAWSNSTGISGPEKSTIHCAFAYEPGDLWMPRLGGNEPLYFENTGDPHPRVAVFSDGTVLLMSGRRMEPRFMVWDGLSWSKTQKAPWQAGILQVQCDGRTAWIIASDASRKSGEVSVSGITNPHATIEYFARK